MKTIWKVFGLVVCLAMLAGIVVPTALGQPLTVNTNKSSYQAGETVTVTVSGGTPNDVVMIQFNNPSGSGVWADQGQFTSGGGFVYQLKIPSGWALGTYTVLVRDEAADDVKTKTFTVYVPAPPPPPPPVTPVIPTNKNPVANAGPDQTCFIGRVLYFDGSKSRDPDGSITSYIWLFGDGKSASGVRVSHVYASLGLYNVTLAVTDNMQATGSDTCLVTCKVLPLSPVAGVDEGVAADEKDYVVDALDEANVTVTVNTTLSVTVTILRYPENPYPDAPLPEIVIPVFVDIFVSNQDSVVWPIYVERHYTDEEATGLDEAMLVIYCYREGAWHRCRETGAYPELNVVWARMYRDEVAGSVTVIGEIPSAAAFEFSDLSVAPLEVEVVESVSVSVKVTNVGDLSGNCTVTLKIDGVVEGAETVTLDGGASTTVSFTVMRNVSGTYGVEVDGLTGSFVVVRLPVPAEFVLSDFVTPFIVRVGEVANVSVTVTNVGEEAGSHTVTFKVKGAVVDSRTVELGGGESTSVGFSFTPEVAEIYTVSVDGLTGSVTAIAPPPPPPEEKPFPWPLVIGVVVVAVALVVVFYLVSRRSKFSSWGAS